MQTKIESEKSQADSRKPQRLNFPGKMIKKEHKTASIKAQAMLFFFFQIKGRCEKFSLAKKRKSKYSALFLGGSYSLKQMKPQRYISNNKENQKRYFCRCNSLAMDDDDDDGERKKNKIREKFI